MVAVHAFWVSSKRLWCVLKLVFFIAHLWLIQKFGVDVRANPLLASPPPRMFITGDL